MKILIASSEAVPYVKTGGLADVAGALFKEFRKQKQDTILVLPLYSGIDTSRMRLADVKVSLQIPVGDRMVSGRVLSDRDAVYFIKCDEFFDRSEPYGSSEGDFSDNSSRFAFFSKAVLDMCKALPFKPDIIHCNDWQTGLIPFYLRTLHREDVFFAGTATLLTIHNLGYQGLFPASHLPLTNLGWEHFTPDGIEFFGEVNFLKAGLIAADVLTTVSETYSREILLPEFGFGLDGVLRKRAVDLYGIVNGIDYAEWDPAGDRHLPATYHSGDLSGKSICKQKIMEALFPRAAAARSSKVPLIGAVTRFSQQKGMDLVLEAIPDILSFGVRIAILGKGDELYQRRFRDISERYSNSISVTIGYDESLAHRIYAGSDFFLMPSKYEPCGLGQLIALRYGAIPIVRRTGGLADTVNDYDPLTGGGTGFHFFDYTASCMTDALKRAFCVYTDPQKMHTVIESGMKMDFSWKRSARQYLALYRSAVRTKKG